MTTAHHRPTRRAAAFRDVDTVTVRCPRCRVRLAEVWTEETARRGWDGPVYAERLVPYLFPNAEGGVTYLDASIGPGDHAHQPVHGPRSLIDPDKWRCQKCTAPYTINDADLRDAIAAAKGSPPEIMLGEAAARPARGVSRDW